MALALVLGRPIGEHEYPVRAGQLLGEARARTRRHGRPAAARRAPLLDRARAAARSAPGLPDATEAQIALEEALADDSGFVAAPVALETFLSRYIAVMLDPVAPVPADAATAGAPRRSDPPIAAPAPNVIREFLDSSPASKPRVDPPVVSAPRVRVDPPVVSAPTVRVEPPVVRVEPPVMSAPTVRVEPPVVSPDPEVSAWPDDGFKPSFAAMSPVTSPAASPAAAQSVINPPRETETVAPAPSSFDAPFATRPAVDASFASALKSLEPIEPKAPVEPPAVSVSRTPVEPPAVSVAKPSVAAESSAAEKPEARDIEARDITELLRDFDLPPLPGTPENKHDEIDLDREEPMPRKRFTGWRRVAVVGLAIFALAEGGVIAMRGLRKPVEPTMGSLSVQTNPPGVAVFVDGVARGNTPARISLNAGSHIVELRGRGVPRVMPVTVTGGSEASQYLELPETPSAGSLLVQSDPPGASVSVDGVAHGVAPVSVADLAPGDHEVVLQAEGGPAVKQRVVIQAGVTSSVLAPVSTATPGPVSGWVSVKAPVSIEIREGGRLIGTTDSDKIMLAVGRHEIELVNDTLGYRATRTIQVPPGRVAPISVEFPQGVMNVNASPWAEVYVDGKRVGETPIGNLPISIGPHEIVFRHPQFGEKRQAVSVTLKAPVRLSVDMKQQ